MVIYVFLIRQKDVYVGLLVFWFTLLYISFISIHFEYSRKCLINHFNHRSHSAWLPVGQSTGLTATAAELQHKDGRHSLPNWLQSTNAPGHNPVGQGTQSVPRAAKVLVRWWAMTVATTWDSLTCPFHRSLHNTKLVAYQLRFLAHSLDKGCHHLREFSLMHCAVGDGGIRSFLETCGRESFSTLRVLDLTNNKISMLY